MANVVYSGKKKITFTVTDAGGGNANWSVTVATGSDSATYVSTGPIEIWIGDTHILTSYHGTYTSTSGSAYRNLDHSINFKSANSDRTFPSANGSTSGTTYVGGGTKTIKMYVDYCYSGVTWESTSSVTITENLTKGLFITMNSSKYLELFTHSAVRLPTWDALGGSNPQDDIVWYEPGAGSWSRGGTTWQYGVGAYHSAGNLDAAWFTHIYKVGGDGLGNTSWYPRVKVVYHANGGSSTPSTQTKYIGSTLKIASAISRNNGSTTGYTITYKANNGTGGPTTQTSGNRTVTYTFDKWAVDSASGSTKVSAGATIAEMSWNAREQGVWTGNNGWGTTDPSSNINTNNEIPLYATWKSTTGTNSSWTVTSSTPTRAGYIFLGWSTSSTATSPTYTAGSTYTITGNLTVYAVWKEDQAKVRIKVDGAWKVGRLYYKENNAWKKVRKVYVKESNTWKINKPE